MSTLAVMKSRIADELARADLTSQIAYAISDAIAAYQDEEFHFNEQRIDFSTVIDKEFYDENDVPALATIEKIEWVRIFISDSPARLRAMTPDAIEAASANGTSKGDPWGYCWHAEEMRLHPIPVAARTVRVCAKVSIPVPASDAEAGNAWMTHGERLIRCRAKFELYTHVIRNSKKAADMWELAEEAESQLKRRLTKKTRTDTNTIEPMEF